MKSIDIVLPVYNEEPGILLFVNTLSGVLASLRDRWEFHVIFVVDRSRDRSFEILADLAAQRQDITVLHLSRRFGHQMSLVAGMDHSRGDAVIMMDSDLQHPPELIPKLIEEFEKGFEIVHTVREYDQATTFFKRFTSDLFYQLQNSLSPVELRQGVADFRLVSRKVVEVFQRDIREHHQFLRGLFQWVGYRATYVPFVCRPRVAGVTKYNLGRLLSFFSDGIVSFSRVPLRIAILAGFCMTIFSLAYGTYLLGKFLSDGNFPRGYTSMILAFLLVGGLQLILLGVVGEYIGHIFDEVKHRPLYVVADIVTYEHQLHPGVTSAVTSRRTRA